MVFVPFCGVDNHRKCVTFAAGLLSKEDIEHFTWVFEAFVRAMARHPLCIITDQCPAMKQALPAVFPNTRHRLCMWHIMKKLSTKVGPVMCKDGEFMSQIKEFVWGENLDVLQFEEGWNRVIEQFDLGGNEWLAEMYRIRESWIPAFFRDDPLLGILRTTSWSESANAFFGKFNNCTDTITEFFVRFDTAMEKQRNVNLRLNNECSTLMPNMVTELLIEMDAAEIYTTYIFYLVQDEIKEACFSLAIKSMDCGEELRNLVVKDLKAKKEFQVNYRQKDNVVECSCKLFERIGILCRHGILALKEASVFKLPRKFVLNRWSKNAEMRVSSLMPANVSEECDNIESVNVKVNNIWFDFNASLGLAGLDSENIDYIAKVVKDLKHEMRIRRGTNVVTSKKDIIQNLIGSVIPEDVTVMPPNESRNKGCGRKRIVGEVEKAIAQSEKPKRRCRGCDQLVNHDKRTCPELKGLQ